MTVYGQDDVLALRNLEVAGPNAVDAIFATAGNPALGTNSHFPKPSTINRGDLMFKTFKFTDKHHFLKISILIVMYGPYHKNREDGY